MEKNTIFIKLIVISLYYISALSQAIYLPLILIQKEEIKIIRKGLSIPLKGEGTYGILTG